MVGAYNRCAKLIMIILQQPILLYFHCLSYNYIDLTLKIKIKILTSHFVIITLKFSLRIHISLTKFAYIGSVLMDSLT